MVQEMDVTRPKYKTLTAEQMENLLKRLFDHPYMQMALADALEAELNTAATHSELTDIDADTETLELAYGDEKRGVVLYIDFAVTTGGETQNYTSHCDIATGH